MTSTKKKGVLNNIKVMIGGSVLAQIIAITTSPIITRLYSPGEFGYLALIVSCSTILASVATYKIEFAIPNQRNMENANLLKKASITLLLINTPILISLAYIIGYFNDKTELSFIALVLLLSYSISYLSILSNFANYEKLYVKLSKVQVFGSLTTVIFKLAISFVNTTIGLVVSTIIGNVYSSKCLSNTSDNKPLNLSDCKKVIKENISFLKFYFPNSLFSVLSLQIPVIAIGSIYGSSILGFYSLALRMLQIPAAFIGVSVGKVIYKELSSLEVNSTKRILITRVLFSLSCIGIIPLLLINIYGLEVFQIMFGNNWGIAGEISKKLSFWVFLVFVLSPVNCVFIVNDKQHITFLISVMLFLSRSILIIFAFLYKIDYVLFFSLFGIISTLGWLFTGYYTLKVAGFSNRVSCLSAGIFIMIYLVAISWWN